MKTVAFELVDGIALIRGKIGDTAGHFALDTGAAQTVFNQTYCDTANAAAKEAITFDGGTQSSKVSSGDSIRFTLSDEEIELKKPLLMDMTYAETPLRKEKPDLIFLGSIGADRLGTGLFLMDYPQRQAVFQADAVPASAKEIRLSVEKLPVVELEIQQKPYRFVLDTGANHFAMDRTVTPVEFICDSGDADAPHCIPSLTFAGMEYQNLTGMVTDLSAVRDALQVDGIIGYQLLKDYVCCFDYENERLYLK